MLSGTFHSGMSFDESDWRSKAGNLGSLNLFRTLFGPEQFPRNLAAVEDLKRRAAKYEKTLPQFALRWTLSSPVVGTALVGFRTPAEVRENLGALGWEIQQGRYSRGRCHPRPPRRSDRAAGLARGLGRTNQVRDVLSPSRGG
jgi:aryl-alcohol dehydrogenase-like predicted oxidoreductase